MVACCNTLTQPNDARERVNDLEAPRRGSCDQQTAIVGTEIKGRICTPIGTGLNRLARHAGLVERGLAFGRARPMLRPHRLVGRECGLLLTKDHSTSRR